jgi:orotate phosphoribosyltransferase
VSLSTAQREAIGLAYRRTVNSSDPHAFDNILIPAIEKALGESSSRPGFDFTGKPLFTFTDVVTTNTSRPECARLVEEARTKVRSW